MNIELGTAVSNKQWASHPCIFSGQTFKIFWEPRFASFAKFSFPGTVLFPKSSYSSFWSLTASLLSMCPKEGPEVALESAITTSDHSSLPVIDSIPSVFHAFYDSSFLVFTLVVFGSTGSGVCSKTEGFSILSRSITAYRTCFEKDLPPAFRLVTMTTLSMFSIMCKTLFSRFFWFTWSLWGISLAKVFFECALLLPFYASYVEVCVFRTVYGSVPWSATI